jgi:hypothetical protein
MDASGGVLRTAVRVVMEPALRLIQGDAPVERTEEVVSSHPRQRVPDKTDRTAVGLFATGATSETREQDALARERLDYVADLELLLRLPSEFSPSAGGLVGSGAVEDNVPVALDPVHHQHILLAIELDLELFRRDSHDPNPRS